MIHQSISGIPMDMALQMMSQYIYEKKGVMVRIKPPTTPREIELLEQMIGVVLAHFSINI
jgi:hypothetical protein